MQLKEVLQKTGLTEKAIKHYEKCGLIHVSRQANNYRDYSEEDVQTLHQISVYRKLGIDIQYIKKMLEDKNEEQAILSSILDKQQKELTQQQKKIDYLNRYIQEKCSISELNTWIEYESIASGLKELLPNFYGEIFMYHFMPYLQTPIVSEEQKAAYQNIIHYFKTQHASIPFSLKCNQLLNKLLRPHDVQALTQQLDAQMQSLIEMGEKDYEQLKAKVVKNYKAQQNPFYKYGPIGISKRRFMKALEKCGYYDIFLSNMEKLSPAYHEYRQKLFEINQKICDDLHLEYDKNYHLVIKD